MFIVLNIVLIQEMIQAVAPGDPNPDCPAEPNMPWMLILGGTGIGFLLLLRIAIVKCLRCIKNNQVQKQQDNEHLSSDFFIIRHVATTWPAASASLAAT